MKKQLKEWKKIFPNHVSDKVLTSKKHKEIIELNIAQKSENLIKKWIDIFPKTTYEWPKSTWKGAQNHWPSVQFSSVAQSCPTLCDPMNRSTPGLPVHHQLMEFTQTHAHRGSDAIQPSHPLSSPSPPAPNPSQHPSLFQWVREMQIKTKMTYHLTSVKWLSSKRQQMNASEDVEEREPSGTVAGNAN